MKFIDKSILITGAGTGIGNALARNLLDEGARVILTGRRRDKLMDTIASARNAQNATVLTADVTRHKDLRALVQTVVQQHGRIDVLINNAGTAYAGAITEVQPEEVEYLSKVNLVAPIWLAQLVIPIMRQQNEGLIVNIASVASLVAVPNQSFYCGTKHGLHGFSLALRRELLGSAIDVLTVYPGGVASELMSEKVQKTMAQSKLKLAELMSAERAADLIISGMRRRRPMIYVTGLRERLLIQANRVAPGIVDRKMKSMSAAIHKVLTAATNEVRTRTILSKLE